MNNKLNVIGYALMMLIIVCVACGGPAAQAEVEKAPDTTKRVSPDTGATNPGAPDKQDPVVPDKPKPNTPDKQDPVVPDKPKPNTPDKQNLPDTALESIKV